MIDGFKMMNWLTWLIIVSTLSNMFIVEHEKIYLYWEGISYILSIWFYNSIYIIEFGKSLKIIFILNDR